MVSYYRCLGLKNEDVNKDFWTNRKQAKKSKFLKNCLPSLYVVLFCMLASNDVTAQLDSLHYLPPLHSRVNTQVNNHYLYLSTPETIPFVVTLEDGAGNILATPTISQGNPFRYTVGNGQSPSTKLMVDASDVGTVLTSSGIIASGNGQFYCNFRVQSGAQAGSLTSKGQSAFGDHFFVGVMPIGSNNSFRNGVASIMAVHDSTNVQVTGYDPGVVFEGNPLITSNTLTIFLNAGECFVMAINSNTASNLIGFVGAEINSNRDIVLSHGNFLGTIAALGSQDIMIDQSVPVERLGTEYVTIRGNGSDLMEIPMVVATEDNTDVFINGSSTAITTIANAGDYFFIPPTNYTGALHSNMYISTSKPVYLYQNLAGLNSNATSGLNLVPPLSCFLPNEVDQISAIDSIGSGAYQAEMMVITASGSTVTVNGGPIAASTGPEPVLGSGGAWETYKIAGLSGNVSVTSSGPMAVGMFAGGGSSGFSAYFSDFGSKPVLDLISLNTVGGVPCLPADSITVDGSFDTYQWYMDSTLIAGATNSAYTPLLEANYFVVVSRIGCVDTSIIVEVLDCSTILPIELLSFTAVLKDDRYVALNWTTASELNNNYFVVEKSIDGINWQEVLIKAGAGNSSNILSYEEVDLDPIKGTSYYRLKQVDFNGNDSYSDLEAVNFAQGFEIVSVYPNPTDDQINIIVHTEKKIELDVFIYSTDGRLAQLKRIESLNIGSNELSVDVSSLRAGTYILKVLSRDEQFGHQKMFFVK